MTATRRPGPQPGPGGPGGGRADEAPDQPRRHDPRVDPPTRADRRRFFGWVALLAICPICVGVVVWAAVGMNGSYPTVKPPVPQGWQAVPGVYASFSAPKGWSLQQALSDPAGDIYFAGQGGGVGESVVQADHAPSPGAPLPAVVTAFLGGGHRSLSYRPAQVRGAARAYDYHFVLTDGRQAEAVMAWAPGTQSLAWLVAVPAGPTSREVLSTFTLAP